MNDEKDFICVFLLFFVVVLMIVCATATEIGNKTKEVELKTNIKINANISI